MVLHKFWPVFIKIPRSVVPTSLLLLLLLRALPPQLMCLAPLHCPPRRKHRNIEDLHSFTSKIVVFAAQIEGSTFSKLMILMFWLWSWKVYWRIHMVLPNKLSKGSDGSTKPWSLTTKCQQTFRLNHLCRVWWWLGNCADVLGRWKMYWAPWNIFWALLHKTSQPEHELNAKYWVNELKHFSSVNMKQSYDTTRFLRILLPIADNREQWLRLTPTLK